MATIRQGKQLKNGEIPYEVQVYSNGRLNSKTWRRPVGMKEHEAKRKLELFASQYEDNIRKKTILNKKDDVEKHDSMTFGELADRWIKLSNQKNAKTSIKRNTKIVKELKGFLGNNLLKRIKPIDIEKIVIHLNERIVKNEIAKLKKPINEAVSKINTDKMCRENDFSTASVFYARKGVDILWTTAEKLAKGLGINVNEYFKKITNERPFSKGSKLIYRRILFAIFNYGIKLELLDKNPAQKVFTVKDITGEMPEKDILNLDEIKALQKAISKETDIRIKTTIAMLLTLGLRKGELCGLKWSDIDFNKKILAIQRSSSYCGSNIGMVTKIPKTKSSIRKLFLPDNLLTILHEYKEWYDNEKVRLGSFWYNEDWIFIKNDGRQIDAGTPSWWLRKLLTDNSIRLVGCHSLRHTAITLLLREKISPKIVSEFAGHSDPSVTLGIYSHVFDEDKEEIAGYLNKLLATE